MMEINRKKFKACEWVPPAHRPLASLNADYPAHQRHLGWRFGYFMQPGSRELRHLAWNAQQARWACPNPAHDFPSMRLGECAPFGSGAWLWDPVRECRYSKPVFNQHRSGNVTAWDASRLEGSILCPAGRVCVSKGRLSCNSIAMFFCPRGMRTGGMHPCAAEGGGCCGNGSYGAAAVRFTSHFRAVGARVALAYDVYPYCGDGLDLRVTHHFVDPQRPSAVLLRQGFDQRPEELSTSNRRRVEWVRDIEAGDELDFVIEPRSNHACDGMSVIDIVVWPAAAGAA